MITCLLASSVLVLSFLGVELPALGHVFVSTWFSVLNSLLLNRFNIFDGLIVDVNVNVKVLSTTKFNAHSCDFTPVLCLAVRFASRDFSFGKKVPCTLADFSLSSEPGPSRNCVRARATTSGSHAGGRHGPLPRHQSNHRVLNFFYGFGPKTKLKADTEPRTLSHPNIATYQTSTQNVSHLQTGTVPQKAFLRDVQTRFGAQRQISLAPQD